MTAMDSISRSNHGCLIIQAHRGAAADGVDIGKAIVVRIDALPPLVCTVSACNRAGASGSDHCIVRPFCRACSVHPE